MSTRLFGSLVKAVVDLDQGIMMVDADLLADQEMALLESGSRQAALWGINFYPDMAGDDWIEFDSMINIRPVDDNRTRSVDNPKIQAEIRRVVGGLVR